ncbi:MAG: hypothetical protein JSS30_03840 [Verrucomicrobia bacterium]|nr:hypothetical protein [Verrucomicrobiota bacterium]
MKDFKIARGLIPLMAMTCALIGEEGGDFTGCCEPCCPPKKCIDCECYTPAYYDLRCDWGVFATCDFLYWYAAESNLEYANLIQYTYQPPTENGSVGSQYGYVTQHKYLNTNWDAGVRVGLGVHTLCDGWDFFLNWTYFDNNIHGSRSEPLSSTPEQQFVTGLINGVNDPWAPVDQVRNFTQLASPRVAAKWSLIFNQMDLEFGRKFWLSRWMTARLYTGLRGAWTHTNFTVRANYTANYLPLNGIPRENVTEDARISNRFRNRFWGVGLLGGVQPEFIFGDWCCSTFSLYSNFEGALIWGKFKGRNHIRMRVSSSDAANINGGTLIAGGAGFPITVAANPVEVSSLSRMQGILDLGIGIRWERHWCCDRYSTSVDLGWEHHYWFDFGLYHRAIAGVSQLGGAQSPSFMTPLGTIDYVTNLGFGGLVVRARFDF